VINKVVKIINHLLHPGPYYRWFVGIGISCITYIVHQSHLCVYELFVKFGKRALPLLLGLRIRLYRFSISIVSVRAYFARETFSRVRSTPMVFERIARAAKRFLFFYVNSVYSRHHLIRTQTPSSSGATARFICITNVGNLYYYDCRTV